MTQQDLVDLVDPSLGHDFDAGTLQRARALLAQHAVARLRVERDPDVVHATAAVAGSGYVPYEVHAWLRRTDHPAARAAGEEVVVTTSCTCPVSRQCKHGAATVWAALDQAEQQRRPVWETTLETVLEELAERPRRSGAPSALALQIDLLAPSVGAGWRGGPVLLMRPLRRNAKGTAWIKSGVGWNRLSLGTDPHAFVPEHLEVLSQLQAASTGFRTYSYGNDALALGDVGPRLWRLLQRAVELGVELVPAGALAEVEVTPEELEASVELRGGEPGEQLPGAAGVVAAAGEPGVLAELGVQAQGRWWSGRSLVPVGRPAHGVALLEQLPGPSVAYRAVLAGLSRPLPAAVARLAQEPLWVPAQARARLEAEYLPRLVRQLPVASRDGAVEVARPEPPRLLLQVDWAEATRAALRWRWAYGRGEGVVEHGLTDADQERDPRGLRDPEAEQELLAEVVGSGLVDHLLSAGALREHDEVAGAAALALGRWVLPALRESGLVEVRETAAPTFREAEGAPSIHVGAEEGAGPAGRGAGGGQDWLDLWVTVRIDDEQVPLPTVLEALTLGEPLIVLPSGLFFPTDHPALTRLRELVQAAAEIHGTGEDDEEGLRVSVDDVDAWTTLAEIAEIDRAAAAWAERAEALRDLDELPERPVPTGLVTELRAYQRTGFSWLGFLREHGLGGVLADDMGLGKTLQVLAAIAEARGAGSAPFLVVAPTSVVGAWVSEAARHAPDLTVVAATGSWSRHGGAAELARQLETADVVVTSYTLLRLDEVYATHEWGGLVLDEAQHVKNHRSKGHAAVRAIRAPFRVAVTGTPFENRLLELWSLLSITNPGLYPHPARFSRHVVRPIEAGEEEALVRLRRRLRPFLLRRTKEVVAADLPPKQEQVLEVELAPRHRTLYDTHLQRERQRILGLLEDFDENRVAVFAALTRLRRLALHAGLVDAEHEGLPSAKLDVLVEHLHELAAEGHRALVFSQFTSFLTRVRARLDDEGIASAYLDGSTRDRPAVVEGFRSGQQPVFLISLKAGGVGLTLTEADYVFVLDPWWNPAVEAQAVDRAHRIGQTRSVHVYRLVSAETIEEKVMALKEQKAQLFADVLDGGGGFGAAIGADDIRALFED
ncbi:DEAD/DEAH box helicase [Nocardioides nanhaiensis]|uniref:DEAD/DEAH box helicase n=1 Tax=Nocardioides nanhaiensis TaxID=1476871 RepID=A0ABP8W8S8_9ACTN